LDADTYRARLDWTGGCQEDAEDISVAIKQDIYREEKETDGTLMV
jgi:hypothetical protein